MPTGQDAAGQLNDELELLSVTVGWLGTLTTGTSRTVVAETSLPGPWA